MTPISLTFMHHSMKDNLVNSWAATPFKFQWKNLRAELCDKALVYIQYIRTSIKENFWCTKQCKTTDISKKLHKWSADRRCSERTCMLNFWLVMRNIWKKYCFILFVWSVVKEPYLILRAINDYSLVWIKNHFKTPQQIINNYIKRICLKYLN